MASPSKAKGNRFEKECVKKAEEKNLKSKRAWGSDGRSLGLSEKVDLVIEDYTVQCKVRKRIAKWIKPELEGKHIQVVKEDRGEIYAIVRLELFLDLVANTKK
tara:strand:+ start:401 stop:709 length:309 start_codon:yes stop_codon:yes gene_type:complete